MLETILFSSLGQLATGVLIFIAFIPPSKIGKGFGRFHTGLAWILWLLAVHAHLTIPFIVLTALLLLAFFFSAKDGIYYSFLCSSILVSAYLLFESHGSLPRFILFDLPASLVLGASAVSMLLGHWYLVAPKLSIHYLKVLTIGLIASLLLRSALMVVMMLNSSQHLAEIHFYDIYGILLLQRILLGLGLSLVFSVLTYFCVRIRSTQSATGILYVVLVFCIVGEVIGSYLFSKSGVFF